MSKRFVIECAWHGRICHREVRNYFPKKLAAIHTILFTDGTTMSVDVRPASFREKVQKIDGYSSLLWDFVCAGMTGYCKVQDVIDRESRRKEKLATAAPRQGEETI